MTYATIHTLLDTQLQTVAGLPTLQEENTQKVPTNLTEYVRSTLIPTQPLVRSTKTDELTGLYQIDVFYAPGRGTASANSMVDLIVAAFERGVILTSGGVSLHVRQAWREAARPDPKFYHVPVMVRWSVLTTRA